MTKPMQRQGVPLGPQALTGSSPAKRQAVVLLEVLSGVRTPGEGSRLLGVSVSRYYALETRALQGVIAALEPRPKGKRRSLASERDLLLRDKRRLEREVGRLQCLVRASQRALGIPSLAAPEGGKLGDKGKPGSGKRRRTLVRAARAIAVLQEEGTPTASRSEGEAGRVTASPGTV